VDALEIEHDVPQLNDLAAECGEFGVVIGDARFEHA